MANKDFYVIIPAHNEERNLGAVLDKTKKVVGKDRIIVVDDGSSDGTVVEAKKKGVKVLRHVINLGKGAALRTGSSYAIKKGAKAVVFMDSDGQHDPKDIPRITGMLKDNDIVFTYRDRKSVHMPLIKKLGNGLIDFTMSLLFGIEVTDTQCGYKAMTTGTYRKMALMSNDYGIESEMVAKTGKHHLKFTQLPIQTVYVDKYKGTTVFDGVNIMLKILWWKLVK
jgi:UDP-N-acetylglucosamine---dolichyl-phosphate N-acetylglucosaminyltransferase